MIKNYILTALILTGIRAPLPAQVAAETEVMFSVNAPKNIPAGSTANEAYPVRNCVFFNLESTEIPSRYVLLSKEQVKYFNEDELVVTTSKNQSGRSGQERIVYYNVLNILGDRMERNPATTITLIGSSEKSREDGWAMARPVKGYLVGVFGIEATRISIAGRYKPKVPSKPPVDPHERLLQEENRNVSIESSSPVLLTAFRSNPDARLNPLGTVARPEAPLDSYVSFDVKGGKGVISSWSMEIRDEKGRVQYFGPYAQATARIPGNSILGTRPEGQYTATMIARTKRGKTVRKETSMHIVRWSPPKNEHGMRFSVLFELNEWKAIPLYEKYLTDIVIPKIPKGGTVVIHGYPDTTGDEARNQKLSLARANDVVTIIENGLLKADRSDVTFEVFAFGDDQNFSPPENKFPEERFNNRSAIIDVVPR